MTKGNTLLTKLQAVAKKYEHLGNGFDAFLPLDLNGQESASTKKTQSVVLRDAKIIYTIADYYHRSVNELINIALEFYLGTFFDHNRQTSVLMEASSFSFLKKHALVHNSNETALLREAFEIYIRFVQDRLLEQLTKEVSDIENIQQMAAVVVELLQNALDKVRQNEKAAPRGFQIGEESGRQSILPMYYFKPLYRFKDESQKTNRKQSIVIKNASLIAKITDYYRWTVNELVNVALDVYIMSLYDRDVEAGRIVESDCFLTLKKYAIANATSECKYFREALDIYAWLLKDEIIYKVKNIIANSKSSRTLQGVLSEMIGAGLQELSKR